MPVIKILHICSVSSEDPSHQADNLLNLETYRKWKCASAGEKKAIVVLQALPALLMDREKNRRSVENAGSAWLEKSTQIQSIDIGNDGSAFVEVLVGRSTAPDSYEVLLGMSTFMTPPESKQWNYISRVRIFGKDKLSKSVADQKWDRVKLVCTQPYNKNERYGLSFVKLHSPPSGDDSASSSITTAGETTPTSPAPSTTPPKLGRFAMKEETKDLPSGSLFFRKDTSKTSSAPSPSAAAKARMATAAALKATDQSDSSSSSAAKQTDQLDSVVKSKVGGGSSSVGNSSGSKRKRPTTDSTPSKAAAAPPKRSKVSESKADESVPFNDIMSGVVFVLSGFKNPYRGELREKAMEMGAKYEADWKDSCTHLVCAFANTPKFNQVRGKHGLIVRKEWILDSYSKRKRLPAKKYRLSSGNGDTSSSEDERYDRREAKIYGSSARKTSETTAKVSTMKGTSKKANEEEDPYGGSTDDDSDMDTQEAAVKGKSLTPPPSNEDSECDTEDEIERVRQKQSRAEAKEEDDPYGGSTDEENGEESKPEQAGSSVDDAAKSLLDLSDFFSNCNFLLYGSYSSSDRRLLTRYITAYCGTIEEYMNEQVKYVITQEEWDDNFDKALTENSALAFVRPKWVFVCHQKQKLMPYQPYAVVPH